MASGPKTAEGAEVDDAARKTSQSILRTRPPRQPVARAARPSILERLNADTTSDEDEAEEEVDSEDDRKPAAKPDKPAPEERLFSSSSGEESESSERVRTVAEAPAGSDKKRVRWNRGVKPPAKGANLESLFNAITLSDDKLLFIKFKPYGASAYSWALVQVDMDETNRYQAITKGTYRCRWFGAHPEDAKHKSARDSRFWPIVHRLDSEGFFREQQVVSPDKVHGFLERRADMGWYQLDVRLSKDKLSEPFDFTTVRVGTRVDRWRVSDEQWDEMMNNARKHNIPTTDVDFVPRPRAVRGNGRGRGRRGGRGRR